MIDIIDPKDEFSCADFVSVASDAIKKVLSQGKIPVLCGGTGLYIDNLIYNTDFSPVGGDDEYRAQLEEYSNDKLHEMLCEIDNESGAAIHKNNRKRVIRALEIYHLTGKNKSYWDGLSRVKTSLYNPIKITLLPSDRQYLYDRINLRVDKMLSDGLVEEARGIDLQSCATAGQAIAYKELAGYFNGDISLDEAVVSLKQATRNYAKRQITWFSRNNDGLIIDISSCDFNQQLEMSIEYVKKKTEEA
jgi:tRNA dimethylallyltransferase